MKIGFVGLGIMGKPMALNLLAAGYDLSAYGRRGVPEDAVRAGAMPAASARALAQTCDVVITMVPDTPDVEEVLFGAGGIAEGLSPGKTVVDMSSISPVATRDFAARIQALGADYLDAPVSGGETGAQAATLSIMVGGAADVFERIKPVFEVLGKNITHVGGNGAGQVAKVANQIIVALTIEAVGEALLLGIEGGRRSGKGPPGAARRLCPFAYPRSACAAHDRAHLRAGLPHRASPEGHRTCPPDRRASGNEPAEHGNRAAALQCLRGAGRPGCGSFGADPRAGAARRP